MLCHETKIVEHIYMLLNIVSSISHSLHVELRTSSYKIDPLRSPQPLHS